MGSEPTPPETAPIAPIASVRFPTRLEDMTPDVVQRVMAQRHPDVRVASVDVTSHARCGDGIASTADRVQLALTYDGDPGLPERMVVKTILLHRWLRFGLPVILALSAVLRVLDGIPLIGGAARAGLFSLVNLYQRYFPHAPPAMYANEVRFYHAIRPELEIEAPQSYGSVFDERSGQFGVLMEDLSVRRARFPTATTPVSLAEVESLLDTLAGLHAEFWEHERLKRDLAWVPTTIEGGMFPVFDGIGLDLIRDQVRKNRFKRELIAPIGLSLDEMWERMWRVQRLHCAGPTTLLHGDTHIANTYLVDGAAGLLDFQLTVRGHWAHDVTYLIVTALQTPIRRVEDKRLLAYYLERLRHHGVADDQVPTADEAWRAYTLEVTWGLVIGWLITPPQNYGLAVTHANISRLVDAALDLGSFEAAGELGVDEPPQSGSA